jgi:hypothetical protein
LIRHFTLISNVKNAKVIDEEKVKHADVTALRISNVSSWIDPLTHLNSDFPKHLMKEVNVAESLEVGGKVTLDGVRFMIARVNPSSYKHLGFVDEGERTEQLKNAIHKKIMLEGRKT